MHVDFLVFNVNTYICYEHCIITCILQIGDLQVAKALIVFDAKINIVNIDDQTPLDLVPRHSPLEEFLVLLGALRYQEIHRSRVQVDGMGISFLDDPEEDDTSSTYLDQTEPTSEVNTEQFAHGGDLCASRSRTLCPTDSTPSGLSSLPGG